MTLQAKLSSKNQITIPVEVCKKMNIKAGSKILFIELQPGNFRLVQAPPKNTSKSWAKNLYGKYQVPGVDAVQSLLDDRKEDLILEERGYLNDEK